MKKRDSSCFSFELYLALFPKFAPNSRVCERSLAGRRASLSDAELLLVA